MRKPIVLATLLIVSFFTLAGKTNERKSTPFESHRTLFAANVPAFENLANLDQLPARNFNIIALPMKIKEGSGGPLRVIAIL